MHDHLKNKRKHLHNRLNLYLSETHPVASAVIVDTEQKSSRQGWQTHT